MVEDELQDGYLYNGEDGIRAATEPQKLPSSKESQEQDTAPVARKFGETESFLTRITTPDDEVLFRLPISLPRSVPLSAREPCCDKCNQPRTHRYHTNQRLWYVCADHAREGRKMGYEIYGRPLD